MNHTPTNAVFDPEPILESARLVETVDGLRAFLHDIRSVATIAIDTESANFYRYHARLNLIQVATPAGAAIFDPQAIDDFSPFCEFALAQDRQWIFHGGDYDAALLKTELGVLVPRVFDTLLAANFLGLPELGLSALANKYLGFPLDKKYQRCDWSRRPLTGPMIRYALLDAICLLPLRDRLTAELAAQGRLSWVEEECRDLARICREAELPPPNPHAFLVKGASSLSSRGRAILKELWLIREEIAGTINRAPFMVVGNPGLLELARQAPRTRAGLGVLKFVHRDFLQRYGARVLDAIKAGAEAPPIDMPRPPRNQINNSLSGWEVELLRKIRDRRNQEANRLGIPASLLANPHQMCELARHQPVSADLMQQVAGLKWWQAEVLAPVLQDLLAEPAPLTKRKPRRRSRRSPRQEVSS